MSVGLFCGVLWICFVVAMGLLVMLCWCLGGGCATFFFFFCLVWVEEKIGDLGFFLFYFIFYCDVYIILLC